MGIRDTAKVPEYVAFEVQSAIVAVGARETSRRFHVARHTLAVLCSPGATVAVATLAKVLEHLSQRASA